LVSQEKRKEETKRYTSLVALAHINLKSRETQYAKQAVYSKKFREVVVGVVETS